MKPWKPQRIGLALGSGAARGWGHLGVLDALKEKGIEPSIIAGTSIGSVVGAFYSAGQIDFLKNWALSLNRREMLRYLDFKMTPTVGLFQGKRLMKALEAVLGSPLIETLRLPFAAVATDLGSGHEVWLNQGELLQAIRASIAVPGLLTPVLHEGRWLVDGGLVNPVPISVCRALGADFVIAVNLNSETTRTAARQRLTNRKRMPNLIDTVMNALIIMQERISRSRMAGDPPELLIAPPLGEIGLMEFHRAKEAMMIGKEAAIYAIDHYKPFEA